MKSFKSQKKGLDSKDNLGIKVVVINGDSYEEALTTYKRKIAFENIKKLRQKMKLQISADEFRKLRAWGRQE